MSEVRTTMWDVAKKIAHDPKIAKLQEKGWVTEVHERVRAHMHELTTSDLIAEAVRTEGKEMVHELVEQCESSSCASR